MEIFSGNQDITFILSLFFVFALLPPFRALADTKRVETFSKFRLAKDSAAGSVIEALPGTHSGGSGFGNLHGKPDAPIVIAGTDRGNPPIFEGGDRQGLKVSGYSFVKFSNIVFRGFSMDGINIDDGGKVDQATHHIVPDVFRIENIGPKENIDALMMSSVDQFIPRNLQVEGWGISVINLVGCRNSVIENSRFMYRKGYRTANGIQIKGGSHSILVQNSHFLNAGARAVQTGGLTGLWYVHPSVQSYEASDITVAGNTFVGGEAQIAWITAEDSHVHQSLFYLSQK